MSCPSDWHLLDHDPITGRKRYIKIDEGLLHVRETMPVDAILEQNKREANDWQANGGWKAAKRGAVVARVPLVLDNQLKKQSGFDPTKGGGYDTDKYNSLLNDIDYRHLRTGGGKLGKRVVDTPALTGGLKKALKASAKVIIP